MRVLLDTHILFWCLADDPKLSNQARRLIENATEVYISAASYWELAIKIGLGKLEVDLLEIRQAAEQSGFIEVPISSEHAIAILGLANHGEIIQSFWRRPLDYARGEYSRIHESYTNFALHSNLYHLDIA